MKPDLIKKEIEEFRKKHKRPYTEFYIGITKHVGQRLVEGLLLEHASASGGKKFKDGDDYYSEDAESQENAIEIEKHFHSLGMQGEGGGFGDKESKYVYCFIDRRQIGLITEKAKGTAKQVKGEKIMTDLSTYLKKHIID